MPKRKSKSRKSSRTTYTQQIAGLATMGMPAPVQKVASSKWGSKLLLLLVPILIATGVITVSFNGGLPSVSFNQQRAAAVGQQMTEQAIKAAEVIRQQNDLRR
jgi:hypothetical protein